MPSPDAAARHTGAGVARRQAHHERMRDERAREAAAGDAMSSSSHLGRRIARNGGSDSSVVLTVATLDYLPLLLNLLCSVAAAVEAGRWGGYGLVVVAADSGLCARLAPFGERGSYGRNVLADCIEPTSPRLATGRDAYMLKLEAMEGALSHLANQGEATPLAFFVDASSVLFADPRKAVIHSVTDAQTMFLWQDDSYISTRAPARGNLGQSSISVDLAPC